MKKGVFLFTVFIFSSASSTLLYADDYLSSLENESNSTEIDRAAEYGDVKQSQKQEALKGFTTKKLPANLDKNEFKIYLMDNLFDSYLSYLELEQNKKDIVFQQYQKSQTPNVNIIEGLISRLAK